MEDEILKIICKSYPFPLGEVKYVYEKLNSFDKTIRLLDSTLSSAVGIYESLEIYKSLEMIKLCHK